MNILVIGNGFDIAHGLPTQYKDFLKFIEVIKQILDKREFSAIKWGELHSQVKKLIEYNCSNVRNNLYSQSVMWKNLIDENIWIEYFLQNDMHGEENWIDFESEISDLIQSLDYDMNGEGRNLGIYDEIDNVLSNEFLESHERIREFETYKEIKEVLYNDLNKLIRALELYLTEYVNKIECVCKSPDIKEAMIERTKDETGKTKSVKMNKILCFNYTNTFERIYNDNFCNDINYIHGKAKKEHTIETNNMVLGIDEFLPEERQSIHTEFIEFKKFYQRIYKQTGCEYKEWVEEIREEYSSFLHRKIQEIEKETNNIQFIINRLSESSISNKECRQHNVYIFGHSLDVTDRDILRDLILNDNVYTTIFYHNRETMGKQIANLVKIIGEKELIKRTGGKTKTIEFKLQKAMISDKDI